MPFFPIVERSSIPECEMRLLKKLSGPIIRDETVTLIVNKEYQTKVDYMLQNNMFFYYGEPPQPIVLKFVKGIPLTICQW